MIKVFNDAQEYNAYVQGGLTAGDLYYVLDDGSVHFRTNNIDGEDKVYDKGDGGSTPEPQYTELNLNTSQAQSDGKNFYTLISATVGQTIEIYNPNHLTFTVGQAGPYINPTTGEIDGYIIYQNGISSKDGNGTINLEHLYVQNAPNNFEGSYSYDGFCISYYSAAGTPTDGVIYYRIF
jgi:hypothetical protein